MMMFFINCGKWVQSFTIIQWHVRICVVAHQNVINDSFRLFYGIQNITKNKSIHLGWRTLSVAGDRIERLQKSLPESKTKLTHILMITSKLFSFSILYGSSLVENVQFHKVSFILLTQKQILLLMKQYNILHVQIEVKVEDSVE